MLSSDISVVSQTKSRNYEAEGQSGSLHSRMASADWFFLYTQQYNTYITMCLRILQEQDMHESGNLDCRNIVESSEVENKELHVLSVSGAV